MGRKTVLPNTLRKYRQALADSAVLRVLVALAWLCGCGRRGRGEHPERAPVPAESAPEPVAPEALGPQPALEGMAARDAQTVLLAIDGEPPNLNPDLDPDVWTYRLAYDAIYEPLVRPRAPSEGGGWDAVLAERYSVDVDAGRAVFHLRPGVLFHDGHALTAADVKFTFDRLRSSRTRAPRMQALLGELERVEVGGPLLVRFYARKAPANLLPAIAEVGILPQHLFGRGDLNDQPNNRRPVGSGPLRFLSWERGAGPHTIVLGQWDKYWGTPAAARRIVIEVQPDPVRALGLAKRGEIDLLARVPPSYVPEQIDSPNLRAAYEAERRRPARFTMALWNLARPPLGDPAVRRALGLAVDRKRVLEEARHGLGRPIAAPPVDERAPEPPRADPVAAALALDHARLLAHAGTRLRPGQRLQLLVPTGTREAEAAAKRVTETLGKLGIPIERVPADWPLLLLRLRHGMFDGALLEWAGRDPDDLAPLLRTRGSQNYGGYSSKEVDALLPRLRDAAPDERPPIRERLRALLESDAPALYLYAPDEVSLIARRLRPPRPLGDFVLLRDLGPR